jgi:hypothetical protein
MFTLLSSKATRTPPTSTPVTSRKAKITGFFGYLPSTSWLATGIKNLYGLLPTITLSGSGFSVNGFNFDLMNIPKNLRLLLSFCLIANTRADDFYFRDPTGTTNYKLDIESGRGCGSTENLAGAIMSACNATDSFTPYPTRFDHLHTTRSCSYIETVGDGPDYHRFEDFYRAINGTVHAKFENCIKENMDVDRTTPTTNEIIILATVGGGILLLGCAAYYRKKIRSLCSSTAPTASPDIPDDHYSTLPGDANHRQKVNKSDPTAAHKVISNSAFALDINTSGAAAGTTAPRSVLR